MPLPQQFCADGNCVIQETSSGGVIVEEARPALPWSPLKIWIRDFSDAYGESHPDLLEMSRAEVAAFFATRPDGATTWIEIPQADPCVDTYYGFRQDSITAVALWGEGKGVMTVGPNTPTIQASLRSMLDGIHLDAGACEW